MFKGQTSALGLQSFVLVNAAFFDVPRLPGMSRNTMRRNTAAALPEPITVALRDAPAITGLSRSTIYREAAAGRLVLLKSGRTTLLCMDSARRYLATLPKAAIGSAGNAA